MSFRVRARAARIAWGPGLVAAACFAGLSLALYALNRTAWNPVSDGHYSWLYARSLAFDGDVSFANDYAICGDPFGMGFITDAGKPANIFYPGPAVVWTPIIFMLRFPMQLVNVSESMKQGCQGFIPNVALATSSVLGGVVVFCSWLIARRHVSRLAAALAAFAVGAAGHLLLLTSLNPSFSHVHDAASVAAVTALATSPKPARTRGWIALGALLGLAILQRPSNAIFAALLAFPAWRSRSLVGPALACAVALVTGVLPLLWIYRCVFGHFFFFTHGRNFIHWDHAHPLLLLFDQRGGLLMFAPILWLSSLGFILGWTRAPALLATLPAQLVFLPARSFGACASPIWYARDFRTLEYDATGFNFFHPITKRCVQGFVQESDPAWWTLAERGQVVFAAQWPYATRAELLVRSEHPAQVTLTWRDFWGARRRWGTVSVEPGGDRELPMPIPEGAFDSGSNELVVDVEGGPISLAQIRLTDEAPRAPSY